MTFNYGLNTGLGFGLNNYGLTGGLNGYQTASVDYSKLNIFANTMAGQFNNIAYSPISEACVNMAMPTWFNNIANCFNVNFAGLGNGIFGGVTRTNGNATAQVGATTTTTTTKVDASATTKVDEKAKAGSTTQVDKKQAAAKAKSEKVQKEANEICEKLYVAMKGIGTDNKAVDEALAKINKDNVLEVMETYINQYSESMDGETLIESLQNEEWVGWSGRLTKITNGLKDKLAARASEMGLDAEAKSFKAKVSAENNSWFNIDDEVVNNHFNTMLAAMITKRDNG